MPTVPHAYFRMVSANPKANMVKVHEAIGLLAPMLASDVEPAHFPEHITTSWLVEQIMALYQNTTHLHPVVQLLEHDLRLFKEALSCEKKSFPLY